MRNTTNCVRAKKNTKYVYFSERKINLSKIGRFGYKFDTLETNWGEFELKMWIFVFSQTTSVPTSQC